MSADHARQHAHDHADRRHRANPDSQPAVDGPEPGLAHLDQTNVVSLQRTIGNKNVQRLIAEKRSSAGPQAKPGGANHLPPVPGALQRAPKKPKRADQAANLSKLSTFKSNADTRFKLTNDFSTKSLEVGDTTRDKLVALSDIYKQAYGNFRGVLDKAEQEAQNQQDWTNIIVGVACGVAAGLLAAWALPASASLAFELTAQEALIAATSSAVQGGVGAGLSAGVTKMLDVEGKKLDSKGLEPSIMELAIWQKAAEIYRGGLEFSKLGGQLHALTVGISDLIGDVRVYNTGGESDLTDEIINQKVSTLEAKDKELAKVNDELGKRLSELDAIKQAVDGISPADHSVRKMEKDIWILWMSGLALNSNILDLDAIEDHIGPNGLGIVDFGWYTSDADENEAIEKARDTAKMLKAEQQKMLNPGSEPNIPEDKGRQLRILTR